MKLYLSILLVLSGHLSLAIAAFVPDLPRIDFWNDSDLFSFVTRPDLRPPKFKVVTYHPDAVSSGYWFVAPYGTLHEVWHQDRKFSPGQVGPHIYDSQGQLIWSGANLFNHRKVFDFKLSFYDNAQHLTFLLSFATEAPDELRQGAGIILDKTYTVEKTVLVNHGRGLINMHEFTIIDQGQRALLISGINIVYNLATVSLGPSSAMILSSFFQEIDISTGNVLFDWKALDHILPSATLEPPPQSETPWDWFHINSVDKSSKTGDYLVSGRFTWAIYKISGTDGSIIWQLGGKNSSFLQDFTFSYQHDARIRDENSTTTIISFLNNASNGHQTNGNVSSAMWVALDLTKMTARLIRCINRPDGQLTHLRGNVQTLSNDNIFVDWSNHGYLTEFSSDGTLLQEARLASDRFVDYRAYKLNFSANPRDPPVLKVYAYGISPQKTISVFYVSWNGATEVHLWNFYASPGCLLPLRFLGRTLKSGFESIYVFEGYVETAIAEAEAVTGTKLRNSPMVTVTILPGYENGYLGAGCASEAKDSVVSQAAGQQSHAFNPVKYLKSAIQEDILTELSLFFISIAGILAVCWKLQVDQAVGKWIQILRNKVL